MYAVSHVYVWINFITLCMSVFGILLKSFQPLEIHLVEKKNSFTYNLTLHQNKYILASR